MAGFTASGGRRAGAAAALFSLALFGAATPGAAGTLQPHRAVYDLTLGHAEPSTSLVSALGRLVFEIEGSDCDGFSVNFRNVTRVMDREGTRRVTDLRSQTRETVAPAELQFVHETHVDGALASEVEGTARARAGGVTVAVTSPKEATIELERAVFPTAHTRLIIEAAEAGERILAATVYDGGDEADSIYETATVIGPGETGLPGASPRERAVLEAIPNANSLTAWRLVISYFQTGGTDGERVPDYELTFTMLQNGISYDVSFNYGAFTLAGEMTELAITPTPACPVP